MKLKKIESNNFRNYSNIQLNFSDDEKYLILKAKNGTGKTNLIELIYYFTYLKSFRNVLDQDLIKKGNENFILKIEYEESDFINEIKINYKNKKKEIYFNNKLIRKTSELFGKFISIIFSNDDLQIIVGNPSNRRKFFDMFFSIIDYEYFIYLKKYNSIIKQKNNLLKTKNNNNLIKIYNQQLSECIEYIIFKRENLINKISDDFSKKYQFIGNFNQKIKIIYKKSIEKKKETSINDFLNQNINKELQYGFSIYGIHRDDFIFLINEQQFSKFASFGQARLASLVIKLIQAEYYYKYNKILPILLFDDVILELDNIRKKKIIEEIMKYEQVFITFTEDFFIDLFNKNEYISILEIKDGQIKRNN